MTLDEHYPLPVLSDLLMSLGRGNSVFLSLDLLSGYWQMELEPASLEMTAFSMLSGHYEWLRMPFGLKSASLTSQRMINNLFVGTFGNSVFAYLDDLLIAVAVKLAKCEFLKA